MINQDNEIEAKIAADNVDLANFMVWCEQQKPHRYKFVNSPDYYYGQNGNVVRHRVNSQDSHELTVKKRKSGSSTRDRLEIDLKFAETTKADDVTSFLLATGFNLEFSLRKEAHIYWFTEGKTHLSVVIYDVFCEGFPDRRFIEVEAEKGSDVTVEHAKKRVNAWVKDFQDCFHVGDPLNDSLYEIYSGNKYQMVK